MGGAEYAVLTLLRLHGCTRLSAVMSKQASSVYVVVIGQGIGVWHNVVQILLKEFMRPHGRIVF